MSHTYVHCANTTNSSFQGAVSAMETARDKTSQTLPANLPKTTYRLSNWTFSYSH